MYLSIGLMSGTSMDGIDAALIQTDGQTHVKEQGHLHLPYEWRFKILLRAAEYAVRQHSGDLNLAAAQFEIHLDAYLQNKLQIESALQAEFKHELAQYLPLNLKRIIQHSTALHLKASQALLKQTGFAPKDIKVLGYHGQTLYHQPQKGLSVIVGDGKTLAEALNISVVYQFRQQDIAAGGQGAPFAPIYHWALAERDKLTPCVVLNCGGIANATLISQSDPTTLLALDTGPGNALIDAYVRKKTGGKEHCDQDGQYGLQGQVHEGVLKALYAKALMIADENYFAKTGPKSLDVGDLKLIAELETLSLPDACRTLEAFTADSIIRSLQQLECPLPQLWIGAGGGWENPAICTELSTRLSAYLPGTQFRKASEVHWNSAALEAQIFAYLAIRHLQKQDFSFPGTTGVPYPMSGGTLLTCTHQAD